MKSLAEEHLMIALQAKDGALRPVIRSLYEIWVHNDKDDSHNINMELPVFYTHGFCDAEAIGNMMLSDFAYKHLPIYKIEKY